MRKAMLGEGHLRLLGTLEIGHTVHPGCQRLQCWPFPDQKYCGFNREDCVFVRPPGVEKFSLSPDNVWYGRLKLLFTLSVQIDGQDDLVLLATSPFSTTSGWSPLVSINIIQQTLTCFNNH